MNQNGKDRAALYAALSVAALVIITFAVYSNTLLSGFVSDDNRQIIGNPWITGFEHLPEIFSKHSFGFLDTDAVITYRPMIFVVFMLEYALFGLEPWGWHLVNIVLQVTNAVMVYFIVAFLLREARGMAEGAASPLTSYLPPFAAALLFTIHPVNSEVVAWVGCQPELVYTLICLAAFYIHIRGRACAGAGAGRVRSGAYILLPPVLFFLGLFFKETTVALPVIVFIYDWLKEKDGGLVSVKRVVRYLPYVVAFALYLAVRIKALGYVSPPIGYSYYLGLSAAQFLLNAFELFAHYLRSLVAPAGDYPFQVFDPVFSITEPRAFISVLVTLALPVVLFLLRRRLKPGYLIVVAAAFYVFPLLPSLYAIGINQSPYATRYLYLSTVGFSLFIGLVLLRGLDYGASMNKKGVVWGVVALFVAASAFYSVWSSVRGPIWKDEQTMWQASLKGSPGNYIAVYSLAMISMTEGRTGEGIAGLEEALRLNKESEHPDPTMLTMTNKRLGIAYSKAGMVDKAITAFSEYLYVAPDDVVVAYNLAALYKKKGSISDAIEQYRTALLFAEEGWQFRDIYSNLAECFAARGMWNEVVENYENALKYAPGDPFIIGNIARARAMAAPGGG
jgi:tetratricopeptide (TPR) repeat protein